MMKKEIALFFIFIANIVLLAHAAIPHHHFHHQTFNMQCCDECEHHHHSVSATDEHHDHESDHGICVLSNAITLPEKSFDSNNKSSNEKSQLNPLFALVVSNNYQLNSYSGFTRLLSDYIALESSSEFSIPSLRAPPVS